MTLTQDEVTSERKRYMDGEITHSEYYLWLADGLGVDQYDLPVSLERISSSTDERLNEIPLRLWDARHFGVRSKAAGRPMYPKDLWDAKGITAGGTDTSVFADRIEKYWGVRPLEMYGSSEIAMTAIQTWDRKGLTPLPDIALFEFIPLDESRRSRTEPGYEPKTLLLDELRAGETYEIVLTSFKLSPFTRYRISQLVP